MIIPNPVTSIPLMISDPLDPIANAMRMRAWREDALKKLWAALGPGSNALELCEEAARITDSAVTQVWALAQMPEGCALVAVGGYGRGALWPASDVDLMVLAPSDELVSETLLEEAVGRLSAMAWDAGLDPGLVSRRVGECAQLALLDVTIRSAMMERRLITGSAELMTELSKELSGQPALAFYLAKMREQSERHARHGDSPFGLEPNIKEAPGGLRDLQMPMWIAKSMGITGTWEGLKEAGLLTGGEAELAAACEARLSLLRAMLHIERRRRDERLDFEAQAQLAKRLGIGMEDGRSAAAVMMDGFFACARSVVMINEVLLMGLSERLLETNSAPKRVLSNHFYEQGGLLWAEHDSVFAKEPSALLEAFEWMQKEDQVKAMSSACTRALWRASRRVDAWFRADERHREAFMRMMKSPKGVVTELSRMARVGLLGAYLPAFGKAETLMQHDLFHAYTVGRHTLGVIRNLRRFVREDRAHEMPLASEIAMGFDEYWVLYLGALFHDIAKGRGGRHEEKGVDDAHAFCDQHHLTHEQKELVGFLVRWHLEMSRVSQKEDLQDPDVIASFAALCETPRRLDALYLLTCADMRATGPTVWNDWKGSLLQSLWLQTRQYWKHKGLQLSHSGTSLHELELTASSAPDSHMSSVLMSKTEVAKKEAYGHACSAGATETQANHYVKSLDETYFLRTHLDDVRWHASLFARSTQTHPEVAVLHLGERVKVAVWCEDCVGLFATLCSALAKSGLSIDAAKLTSHKSGWVLDSFEAHDLRAGEEPNLVREKQITQSTLKSLDPAAIKGAATLGRVSSRAKYAGAVAQAKVVPAGKNWLVEIACANRSGVLWSIAEVFEKRGIEVKSARISTVGERAEDVFVVTGRLESLEQRVSLEDALVAKLAVVV